MQLRRVFIVLMVFVAMTFVACTSSAAQTDTSTPALELSMEAPSVVQSGEIAQLSLHVRNVTSGSLTVTSGIPPQEFVVKNSDGDEVWSSLATAACPGTGGSPWAMTREDCTVINGFRASAGHEWTFDPGEEKILSDTWDGTTSRTIPVQPGDYTLTGLVELSDGPVSAGPVAITVLP